MKDISTTIREAVGNFRFDETTRSINDFLIEPEQRSLTCEYTEKQVPVWFVAEFPDGYYLAYAPHEKDPWGLVQRNETFLGSDDHWFLTLEDAFMHSQPMQHFRPTGYEVS